MDYKIYDKFNYIFKDYYLTELGRIKNGKKKGLSSNDSVWVLLQSFLKDYGIFTDGKTWLQSEYNETESEVVHCSITRDFKVENEEILRQLFGYSGCSVDIGLYLGMGENCAFSFTYNLDNYSCNFRNHFYGTSDSIETFPNLESLLTYLKNYENE